MEKLLRWWFILMNISRPSKHMQTGGGSLSSETASRESCTEMAGMLRRLRRWWSSINLSTPLPLALVATLRSQVAMVSVALSLKIVHFLVDSQADKD